MFLATDLLNAVNLFLKPANLFNVKIQKTRSKEKWIQA